MRTAGCFHRRGLGDPGRSDRAARARDILDNDGLAKHGGQALARDARHGVGVPAGGIRHHCGNRPCRPITGLRCASNEGQRTEDAGCGLRCAPYGCGRFDEQAMAGWVHRWSLSRCKRSVRAADRPSFRCIFQATGRTATDAQNAKSRRGNAATAFFASCEALASHVSLIVKRFPSLAGLAATYSSKS